MVKSFKQFNKESIQLFISVPASEEMKFRSFTRYRNVTLLTDESYAKDSLVAQGYWGLSMGYINQEICKLSFWTTGLCSNYLCVDSDTIFVRDFFIYDFMYDDSTPYSVLFSDKDLYTEKHYREFGVWRKSQIAKIFSAVENADPRQLTCHGLTVLNSAVLRDFKLKYMEKNNMSYGDLLEISPYEFSWYNAWLQKSNVIPVVGVEPFFKTFHMRIDYIASRFKLIRVEDIATQYVGIVLNSNWKHKPPAGYVDPGVGLKSLYSLWSRL